MCGICGHVRLRPGRGDAATLSAMVPHLRHRGPDDVGTFVDDLAGLANTRLSIIDLAGGHQPAANEDGGIQVVFNGEIYNHAVLREELARGGHRFASRADTEVLAHLYEEAGIDFLPRLNGMFAIALWDAPRRRALLARDRLGIKPLFYTQVNGTLLFASEIKALLAFPGVVAEPDPEALDGYLALRYTGGRGTAFRGIRKLAPGSALIADAGAGTVTEHVYWAPWTAPRPPAVVGQAEAAEQVRELLSDAVRMRLMSDVPFGAFLSGGLDSSGVVALMARHMDEPVQTFAIGFSEEPRLDERAHAEAVARHCGTRHRVVDCTADRVERLPKLLYHFDEPFADPIIVPSHQVAELARQHVKVVLTGEGADELFGGYTRFVRDARVRRLARIPGPVRRSLGALAAALPPAHPLARALALADLPLARRALAWVEAFSPRERRDLYADPGAVTDVAERLYADCDAEAPADDPLGRLLFCELRLRLPECMLARTDRMTMAVSLEGRTPFLDHRLVEHVLWLPHQLKVKGSSEKHVLKAALAPLLPASTPRRRKQGLAVPFALWTRHGVDASIRRILSPNSVRRRGLFRPEAVAGLLAQWGPHAARHSQLIWSLLCLELWFRMYIDGGRDRLDPATPLSQVA